MNERFFFQEVNPDHWLDLTKHSDDACNFIKQTQKDILYKLREIGDSYVSPSVWQDSIDSKENGQQKLFDEQKNL